MSSASDTNRKARFEDLGRKVDDGIRDAARKAEEDSEKVIAYLNDEVVPAIRQGSSRVLRTAAEKLSRMAEYMDRNRKG